MVSKNMFWCLNWPKIVANGLIAFGSAFLTLNFVGEINTAIFGGVVNAFIIGLVALALELKNEADARPPITASNLMLI